MKDRKKLLRLLPTGWAEEADAMKPEELKKVILQSAANLKEIAEAQDGDEDLAQKKYAAADAAAPYRDAKKAQNAKILYALNLLSEKGDPAGTGEVPDTVEAAVQRVRQAAGKAGSVSVSVSGEKVGEF